MSEAGGNVWDTKQDWETMTAFRAFSDYYLHQEPPRNVNEAYRKYYFEKKNKVVKKGKQAPRYFRYWASAKDHKKATKIPGALSWADRAAAYDEYRARAKIRAEAARREKVQNSYFKLIESSIDKLESALKKYVPKGNESIGELTLAARRIYELASAVYGFTPKTFENVDDFDHDREEGAAGRQGMIIRDILAEMADIADKINGTGEEGET